MAEYLIQDTTLTAIGDAIRTKEGSAEAIPVSEFANRISAISTGVTVQNKSDSFTTNTSGKATVNCGFQPDFVAFTRHETDTDDGSKYVTAASFADFEASSFKCSMWSTSGYICDFTITRTTTGFSVSATRFNGSIGGLIQNTSFFYTAVKYT